MREFWIRTISYLLIYIMLFIIHLSIFGLRGDYFLILLAVMTYVYSFIAYKLSKIMLNKYVFVLEGGCDEDSLAPADTNLSEKDLNCAKNDE